MPPKKARAPKKEKNPFDAETIEKYSKSAEELEQRESMLLIQFAQLKEQLLATFARDLERFSESHPETANMLLVDYLSGKNQKNREVKTEPPEDQENKTPLEEGTPAGIPKIIRPKKTGFRVPKANEILFSANGTPITCPETQKILTLTKQCYSEVTEVVTCTSSVSSQDPIPIGDFNEVD